ncbi:MetQ/NlpA family ABC transporter substrate-binding protein [Saccharomonospora viridis]|jgi:D-methionine transport system substrate-binding protein|uniref:ABC-type metal ion transport system, periplasmic component/surface antigen n=2 Tax=Saccharomonospora viridis TaxID=1852 RepID=C7MYD3_SACVD|nr:MetQ/NlpA family ABC transporter substrate-binding protein [Saccharomonospora viridis]ACU97352.1 ABC-type metal ion transport system, periplasmic component/surface antigen [Saccharomonospora viridis DSM 43017]SFP83243.1 D-methionine transport system substrate-binding protein [Saccharomonospora viridis]
MASDNTSGGHNGGDPAEIRLPERPRKGKGPFIALGVVLVAALVAITVVLTGGDDSSGPTDTVTVRIGTTEAGSDYWKPLKRLAAEEGITLETVNFSDYNQPNPALSQGQTDLNLFQHVLFLANYNVSNQDDLTPVGSTYVVPLSLYSRKHTDVEQIPAGGTVAIPKDPTNQARALLVLQEAGLISLKDGGNVLSTPAEIDQAASKVSVTPVDAAQTVAVLDSVDASIVNNGFAMDAGLDPSKALFSDDPRSDAAEPYINIIAARAEDKDNPTYRRVVELFHHPEVLEALRAESRDTSVPVQRPQEELEEILDRLSDTVKAARR